MRPPPADLPRARRLRSPLLIALWALLAFEALGGLVLFTARLVAGASPGEGLHVAGGLALTVCYAVYQWQHWRRVRPFRARLDHGLGLIAALAMALVNLSGMWLGLDWWRGRALPPAARYPTALSGVHNVASMVVLSFVLAHLGAVLQRDRRAP
ncbi:MAG: hypothetical protein HYR74_09095 [Candidatus Eisenbacteria bacterium]|nr:hypothetical protein [Candidatus Eisenbacteria bacterium]